MKRKLDLENIHRLDNGRVGVAANQHLQALIKDLEQRPADETARVLTVRINLKPMLDDRGILDDIDAEVEISAKVPVTRSRPISTRVADGGASLLFNDESQDNVNQGTLDEANQD